MARFRRLTGFIYLLKQSHFHRVFEFVPLSVTALLPAGLFPLLGILGSGETAAKYCTDTIMLLLGSEVRLLRKSRPEMLIGFE